MIYWLKHILKKLLIKYLYKQYVVNSEVIQIDIFQTLSVRGSKAISYSIEKQFSHLMTYYPEFAMIFFWRIRSYPWYKKIFVKEFHCKIFQSTQIGGGLMCYHPFATVINAKQIGENFQFRNSLTIGNKKDNDNTQLPTIGNNVTVGANVVIIGDIKIGDNVFIGAGSVVVHNIPSNSVIAGNPAKIISSLE